MVSAFLNSVKIPELRRRILFTLAVIVIVRLGAAITTPGVNQAVLQEWFRSALTEKAGGGVGGAVQFVQRWRAGKLRDLFVRHHALHQRIDHDAVADGGDSAAGPAGPGRRRPAEDHAVHALRDGRRFAFSRATCWRMSFQHPEAYHIDAAGNYRHDPAAWDSAGRRSGMDVSHRHGDFAHHRHAVPDVAGRSNHRARHRQRHFADHYHRHRGALARGAGPGLENLRAFGPDRQPARSIRRSSS